MSSGWATGGEPHGKTTWLGSETPLEMPGFSASCGPSYILTPDLSAIMATIPIDAEPDTQITYAQRLESRLAFFDQGYGEIPTNMVGPSLKSIINSLDPTGACTRKGEDVFLEPAMRVPLGEDIKFRSSHEIHYYRLTDLRNKVQQAVVPMMAAPSMGDQFNAIYAALPDAAWRRQ
jgi:hypothetical protein